MVITDHIDRRITIVTTDDLIVRLANNQYATYWEIGIERWGKYRDSLSISSYEAINDFLVIGASRNKDRLRELHERIEQCFTDEHFTFDVNDYLNKAEEERLALEGKYIVNGQEHSHLLISYTA